MGFSRGEDQELAYDKIYAILSKFLAPKEAVSLL
jgi:hypothetical protein